MKTKSALIVGLILLAIGLALIFFNRNITSNAVIITGGALFAFSGIINLLVINLYKDSDGKRHINGLPYALAFLVSVGAIILGTCILCFQTTFMPLTPLVFGTLVGLLAILLFYMLALGTRPIILPGWLYILPTLMAVGSVLIFLLYGSDELQEEKDHMMVLYTGISLCLYAVCAIIGSICMASVHHKERKQAKLEAEAKTEAATAADTPKEETTGESATNIKPLDDNK